MQKLLVSLGLGAVIVICWIRGAVAYTPPNYDAQIEAYQNFAEEQAALEAYGSAIDYYKEILELDKKPEYYDRLAEIYMLAEKEADALEVWDICVTMFPNEKEIFKKLINYYYEDASYGTCVDYMERYASANGWEEELVKQYLSAKYHFTIRGQGYEEAGNYYNGYMLVKDINGWHFLTSKYKIDRDLIFDEASPVMGKLIGIVEDGHANFIDLTGLKYLDSSVTYDKAWSFVGGRALIKQGDKYGYVNSQFSLVLNDYLDGTNFVNGVAAVKTAEGWSLINSSGEVLTEEYYSDIKMDEDKICSLGGIIFAKTSEGYIMLDVEGKRVGEAVFEDAKAFSRGQYAAVKVNGKWGYINQDGDIVIEPQYEDAQSFGGDIGAVCVDGQWGFIISNGMMAIEPQFEDAKNEIDGVAPVKHAGLWYYLELDV